MKIALLTITWKRPRLLGRLIECFNRQSSSDCEMVILDDAGDYPDQPSGNHWRIISHNMRYPSLGAKRNACARLVSPDTEGFLICDDDDFLFPWAIEATAHALAKGPWAQPREVYEFNGNRLVRYETFSHTRPNYIDYHSGWSYRRSVFEDMGGYPEQGEEDNPVRDYLTEHLCPSVNTICREFPDPFVIYAGDTTNPRISLLYQKHCSLQDGMFSAAWNESQSAEPDGVFEVGWDRDYLAIPRKPVAQRRRW